MADDLVYVSRQQSDGAEPALASPVFIVESGGKLYLTRAVWEYDESAGGSASTQEGVRQIREMFNAHVGEGDSRAALIPPQLGGTQAFEFTRPNPDDDA